MGWYVMDEHESAEMALQAFFKEYLGWEEGKVKRLEASPIRGGVYFAAVASGERVIGCVFLVRHDKEDGHHCIKYMDESYGPGYYECPREVFDLLTPLKEGESKYAEDWRSQVEAYHGLSRRLDELEQGTRIRFKDSIMICKSNNLLDHYLEDEFVIQREGDAVKVLPVLRDPARVTMPIDSDELLSHPFDIID